MSKPSLESFITDVANHKLAVLMDNGVYRHLRFKQPDSGNMRFDLITGPGYLLYRAPPVDRRDTNGFTAFVREAGETGKS